jgi:hypothetical protein
MSSLMMMRRILPCFLAIPLLAAVFLPVSAKAESISYTVEDVQVSATAGDATTARMNAMSQGESEAFKRLLERLVPSEEVGSRVAATQDYQISRMVRGYEVHNEKVGSTSYAATLDVAFDQAQVESYLNGPVGAGASVMPPPLAAGYPAQGMPARPAPAMASQPPQMRSNVLVLPVLAVGDQRLLWEDKNVWRNAWNSAERTDTQFIRLPIGDQSDSMVMDASQVMSAPYSSFSPIAERYQAATVVVAEAYPTVASGVNALGVRLRSLGMQGQNNTLELSYEQNSSESQEQLMNRAAQDIIQRIMSEGQAQSVEQVEAYAPRSKLTVLSRLNKLNDWVVLRKRLMQLPVVERVELSAISSQQADMIVHFRGSQAQLENAMLSQGLKVNKAYNYWIVGF